MLLFPLQQAQQKRQAMLRPFQLVKRILPPDQTHRYHLRFANLRQIHYTRTVAKRFRLSHCRCDSVGKKRRASHQHAVIVDTHHHLRAFLVGHEHLNHSFFGECAVGGGDEGVFPVDGNWMDRRVQ